MHTTTTASAGNTPPLGFSDGTDSKSAPTSYDKIAYPSHPHPQTHPDRLEVMGRLFGLSPSPASRCRVLELGCGNGANVVPMAWSLPQSEFMGIDLAAHPIEHGRQMIHDLGLGNIRLTHGSVTEIDQTWGNFDYIIAHGLYSWVPAGVRERILAICHDQLAPQGIAFISYNALPGCHLRNMLREMMLFHVRGFESAEERIQQSLAFVRFLAEAQDTDDAYRLWMKAEARRIFDHDEGHLYHDELGGLNEPFYFAQFMDAAARHSLQFLGEADFFEMSDHIFKGSVRKTLMQLSSNRILREQYLDFLKCRRFRQTLLCHRAAQPRSEPQPEAVTGFFVSSAVECRGPASANQAGLTTFERPRGAKVETDYALGKAALVALETVWPRPLSFDDLVQQAASKVKLSDANCTAARTQLSEFLLSVYAAGLVEFRAHVPPITGMIPDRPVASPIARWQAARGNSVTSLFHMAVKVEDEIGRQLLTWLDGNHNRAALTEKLWQFLKSRNALADFGNDEASARLKIASDLETNLSKLTRFGLLTM